MFYYLELDNKDPGFDAAWESSAFASASGEINTIAEQLGMENVFNLMSLKEYDHLMPPGHEEEVVPWFDPQKGIDWLVALSGHIEKNRLAAANTDKLLADFQKCRAILAQAQKIGAKWHFGMDI